jgi:vacuolar-type H+-ATPase subunit H
VNPNEPPSRPRPIATSAADRIATIIEAAERAAAGVIDNADANAQRYLEEAQAEADRIVAARLAALSELTDSLVAQAEAIRRQSEHLLDSLDQAAPRVEPPPARQSIAPEPLAPEADPIAKTAEYDDADDEVELDSDDEFELDAPLEGVRLAAVSPPPPAPAAVPPPAVAASPGFAGDQGTPAGARLLATQMAVSGSSRAEIETRLRSGFEIADPSPILDAILGPEA